MQRYRDKKSNFSRVISSFVNKTTAKKYAKNVTSTTELCNDHKIYFSTPIIFATRWHKPLIFPTLTIVFDLQYFIV